MGTGGHGVDLKEERVDEEGGLVREHLCSRMMPSSLVIVARRSDELLGVL